MTLDEFKADFRAFLEGSTVNLGRKTTKTRQVFINEAMAKFDTFWLEINVDTPIPENEQPTSAPSPMGSSVLCIRPKDRNRALDVGKGVHAMTSSESGRADEQLNRSPYGSKPKGEEKKNE